MHEGRSTGIKQVSLAAVAGAVIGAGITAAIFVTMNPTGVGGTTNPPIKVRGGSMTAYTRDTTVATGGWQTKVQYKVYCTIVNDITIEKIVGPNGGSLTLSYPWEIDIYGNNPVGGAVSATTPSSHGISLKGAKTDCAGQQDSFSNEGSVTLGLLDANDSFYEQDLANVTPWTGNKRFWDKRESCQGDRDSCERMNTIKISFGTTSQTYTCPSGNCELEIGKPTK